MGVSGVGVESPVESPVVRFRGDWRLSSGVGVVTAVFLAFAILCL